MVLAALAFQPELWAAGIECVGISNLGTFLENTSDYRRAAREREYGSLATTASSSSERRREPLDAIRAPLFIEHGAQRSARAGRRVGGDPRACSSAGIRCELVIYEDEGHTVEKLPNRIDVFERAVAFLDEVLGA